MFPGRPTIIAQVVSRAGEVIEQEYKGSPEEAQEWLLTRGTINHAPDTYHGEIWQRTWSTAMSPSPMSRR